MPKAKITALGCYVPPRVMTNQDLEKLVETNDRWIVERTGIRERHILDEGMATSDMAIAAAKCALSQRGIEATRDRRHHRLHRYSRHDVPFHRVSGAKRLRRARSMGIRFDRGLLRLRLRHDHRRAHWWPPERIARCW